MPLRIASTTQPIPPALGQSRYGELANSLRARILSGEWAQDVPLPSERELRTEYKVALGTMRQALQLLAQEGLIERIHGRGTFVKAALSGAPMIRFFRFGNAPGQSPQSQILRRAVMPAPSEVGARLGLPAAHSVLFLERLRLISGKACLHEEIWLPLPRFEALCESNSSEWGDLLYPAFARLCDVHVTRVQDDIGFRQFAAEHAQALGLPPGHPCALVHRLAFDRAGQPVEVRRTRGDAHAFAYTVHIR